MSDFESMCQVSVVDDTITPDEECIGESYKFMLIDSLIVHTTHHNMILSFSIRQAGVDVRTVPKF